MPRENWSKVRRAPSGDMEAGDMDSDCGEVVRPGELYGLLLRTPSTYEPPRRSLSGCGRTLPLCLRVMSPAPVGAAASTSVAVLSDARRWRANSESARRF